MRLGQEQSRQATNALLAQLRSGRFSAGAWGRFVRQTLARSADQAWRHPRALGELSVLHLAIAAACPPSRRRWVASSWLLAVTHLGMLGPARSIGAANVVSLLRANLPAIGSGQPWLGMVAMATDKADGLLARRAGPTHFGHYADSLADSAFWVSFAWRNERSRPLVLASLAAWALPVAAAAGASFARGQMVEVPRHRLLRPAAAMQVVLAMRALRSAKAARASASGALAQPGSGLHEVGRRATNSA